ncbi:hypothetical protein ACFWIO_07700 [Streptomyces diastatochromogenes]|uniref:hypothetical protein n=1 Tax=Streptomyces diastatochromogenes TaxID=42236 RepID=UPI0036465914
MAVSDANSFAMPASMSTRRPASASRAAVTAKHRRTGELLFVRERLEFRQYGRTCLVEEQDIVYRSGRGGGQHPAALDDRAVPHAEGPWQLRLRPDPTLLFRFSALTANAHRIHYDAPYCRDTEGYPGLVVHGPLLGLLMSCTGRRSPASTSWPWARPPPDRRSCASRHTGRPGTHPPRSRSREAAVRRPAHSARAASAAVR